MKPEAAALAVLLLAAGIAGCADPAPPVEGATLPPEGPADDTEAGTDADAGTSTVPEPKPKDSRVEPRQAIDAPAPKPKVLAVKEDGTLGAAAGQPDGAAGMVVLVPVVGHDRWFRQDVPGTVVAADLTMTWTPAPGASEELSLTFSAIEEIEGGERMTDDRASVGGPGPLRLQVDGLAWDGGMFTVAAWWSGDVAHTPVGQEFRIEGTITYLEQA